MVIFSVQFVEAKEIPILPNESLRSEVVELIGATYFGDYEDVDFSVEVMFTVNSNRELIVLSVDAKDQDVRSYFKRKLNYKKVDYVPGKPGEIFLLPVKVLVSNTI